MTGAAGGYPDNAAHLRDELRRVHTLVQAYVAGWRATLGAVRPPETRGLGAVGDAEIDALIAEDGPDATAPSTAARLRAGAADLAREISARLAATADDVDLRLRRLTDGFVLCGLERDVVLLGLLPEQDGRYRRLFGYLLDDGQLTCPTVELALAILRPGAEAPGHPVVEARAPLRRHRLVTLGEGPLPARQLALADRVAAFLFGSDEPDERLAELLDGVPARPIEELVLAEEQAAQLAGIGDRLAGGNRDLAVLVTGPRGSGRRSVAAALAARGGLDLIVIDVRAAEQAPTGFPELVRLVMREAVLQRAAPCWVGVEALLDGAVAARALAVLRETALGGGLTFLVSEAGWDPGGRLPDGRFLRVDLRAPTYAQRRVLWERTLAEAGLAEDVAEVADELANAFQLTGGQIVDAVATARVRATGRSPRRPRLTAEDLREASRGQSSRGLVAFARRVPQTELTVDDLVLPRPSRAQLDELCQRVRRRGHVYETLGFGPRLGLGMGTVALFTGPSGGGKTTAATLVARAHGVDLYKVDLSAVVSKYVGETEKNLARVFADAAAANAMLFFDEADALFGRRGEVKEARDRWANVEAAYLLQAIEEHDGVVLLASNLRQNIDEAFLRRIHVVVDFPAPGPRDRLRIWSGMFPEGVGRPSDEELEPLATRLRLSGGGIRNVVVDAMFRALARDEAATGVTVRDLVAAAAREYQKLGWPILVGEFGAQFHGWAVADLRLDRDEPDEHGEG